MEYRAGRDQVALAHQALAEVSRVRLLELLQANPPGMTAQAAATEVGLHLATVRAHLETLVEAGLAERLTEQRTVRGRPSVIYVAKPGGAEANSGYRLLAELLASLVENTISDPARQAEMAGSAWGRSLIERAKPLASLPEPEAMSRITAMLAELGFDPETKRSGTESEILLHRCPFREVATDHPKVACAAHLGLIKGALDELGMPAADTTLQPFVTPTLCVARLGKS